MISLKSDQMFQFFWSIPFLSIMDTIWANVGFGHFSFVSDSVETLRCLATKFTEITHKILELGLCASEEKPVISVVYYQELPLDLIKTNI